MKRVFSFIVSLVMIVAMLSTFSAFAVESKMGLTLNVKEGLEVERGGTVTLTVGISDYIPANGIQLQGKYDTSFLTYSKKKSMDYPGTFTFNEKFSTEMPIFASWANAEDQTVWDDDDNELTDFDLLRLTFTVAEDAPLEETTLAFSFKRVMHIVGSGGTDYIGGTDYNNEEFSVTLKVVCNHDFTGVEYTKPAEGTAMTEAEHSRVCTKCGQTIPEACEFDSVVTEPGHTAGGYTAHTCTCGYAVVDTETPATGHDWGEYVHDDELTENKHTHTRVCVANDGGAETEECDFSAKYTDPTCTEDGYVTYTCDVCSYSYDVTDEGSAKGHKLQDFDYYGEVGGVHKHIAGCSLCDYEEENDCTMGLWSVTKEPTRTETGLKTRTCVYCKEGYETEELPKQAYFTVSDGEGVCGHEMEVTVSVTNNPGISGVVFELSFDDSQMTLVSAEIGALGAEVPFTMQPANKDGDVYKIALATPDGIVGDGELLKLKFRVADTVTEGDYNVTVATNDACDSSEAMADFTVESDTGVANLRNYMLGDINRDGQVSVADAVQLARYLADMDVTIESYAAELVTDDGAITVADVQFILGVLIGEYSL